MSSNPTTPVRPGIEISNWKPFVKNTLQGFFSATLASGMVLNDLMLHEKNSARWVSFPAREWTNNQGKKQYAQWIEFRDTDTRDRFQEQLLTALDNHLAQTGAIKFVPRADANIQR